MFQSDFSRMLHQIYDKKHLEALEETGGERSSGFLMYNESRVIICFGIILQLTS